MESVLTDQLERTIEQRYFARRFQERARQRVQVTRWVRRLGAQRTH
jgi:hypothetical protein